MPQFIDAAVKLAPIVIATLGGLVVWQFQQSLTQVTQNSLHLAEIRANRYTSNDAIEDSRRAQDRIEALRGWVESNYPPASLLEDIAEIKQQNRSISRELQELKTEMVRIRGGNN